MRFFAVILVCMFLATGCTTRSRARAEAQQAFLAGQKAALEKQLAAQSANITVIGPVSNPSVPWVDGLTLAQAIATANYVGRDNPTEIVITRQGEQARLDASVLLGGVAVPLQPGDVVELR